METFQQEKSISHQSLTKKGAFIGGSIGLVITIFLIIFILIENNPESPAILLIRSPFFIVWIIIIAIFAGYGALLGKLWKHRIARFILFAVILLPIMIMIGLTIGINTVSPV